MRKRLVFAVLAAAVLAVTATFADEGMWRLDQLPLARIQQEYGVKLTPADLERVQGAVVRISSGGTGTFASANGLILTNHHVALDCIRTATLAEQGKGKAEDLIDQGFTAASPAGELSCKRFRAEVETSATDVTAELNAAVEPGMGAGEIQQVRSQKRSDLERACQQKVGDDYTCAVVDFNSGARSLLIVYDVYRDIRLVYAPEKQLGYFGGDEMNFRFPRYVSDISILRAYESPDGHHTEYAPGNVPVKTADYLPVSFAGVKDGDFALVVGNPGNTNRYRMSFSAAYNVATGIPNQISDLETLLGLLRKYSSEKPEYRVILQDRVFGLANTLKYNTDLLAALKASDVVAERQAREAGFTAWVKANPQKGAPYAHVIDDQRAVYAKDVEVNEAHDSALNWLQQPDAVAYATTLYEFALERAKPSDREREPQFQERNWPNLRQALLSDDPEIPALDADLLAVGLERALALPDNQRPKAVDALKARMGARSTPASMAKAVIDGTKVLTLAGRKALIDAAPAVFEASTDPAVVFARELLPAVQDLRARVNVLNEKLFLNRAAFAKGLAAWKGQALYPDANFTLRATYGKVAGYTNAEGKAVPFTTYFGDMFKLAAARGDTGDFALPAKLEAWRKKVGDAKFAAKYARLPMDFVTTNDITGGNSGSALLNAKLEIVGLVFDGNKEGMAGDWVYSGKAGRALSTDIRLALTIARDVHGAGWIVDELLHPSAMLKVADARQAAPAAGARGR